MNFRREAGSGGRRHASPPGSCSEDVSSRHSISTKYDRASKSYDRMEALIETLLFRKARRRAVAHVRGEVLEIGVGTGKNLPFYPESATVTGIDVSCGMLERARRRAARLNNTEIRLRRMDAEAMPFPDDSFDTVISTFVFCTVANPHAGLGEALRVLKPAGKAIFLEHMRSRHVFLNAVLGFMNLFTLPLLGTSMTRDTEANIRAAGFVVHDVELLFLDIVRLIVATKNADASAKA